MTSPAQLLNEKLKGRNFFGECILWEFHSTRFGYGLDLSFNYVWDGSGHVREDALERPKLYVFISLVLIPFGSWRALSLLRPTLE
jgi:hypothetical protein